MYDSFAMQVIESFSYLKDHCFYSILGHRFEVAAFHMHVQVASLVEACYQQSFAIFLEVLYHVQDVHMLALFENGRFVSDLQLFRISYCPHTANFNRYMGSCGLVSSMEYCHQFSDLDWLWANLILADSFLETLPPEQFQVPSLPQTIRIKVDKSQFVSGKRQFESVINRLRDCTGLVQSYHNVRLLDVC